MAYVDPAYKNPDLNLKNASTGDPSPANREKDSPGPRERDAINRRTVRQAIITQLLSEVAKEILDSKATITVRNPKDGTVISKGDLRPRFDKGEFPKLRALIKDPEMEFNKWRDQLLVGQPFGSINLVVFRNAMAIGEERDIDPEEVAKRVVIRAGRSGYYSKLGFAGCK